MRMHQQCASHTAFVTSHVSRILPAALTRVTDARYDIWRHDFTKLLQSFGSFLLTPLPKRLPAALQSLLLFKGGGSASLGTWHQRIPNRITTESFVRRFDDHFIWTWRSGGRPRTNIGIPSMKEGRPPYVLTPYHRTQQHFSASTALKKKFSPPHVTVTEK